MKDLQTRSVIARCNSTGDLYRSSHPPTHLPLPLRPCPLPHGTVLGHLSSKALSKLISFQAIACPKPKNDQVCHACQLGWHVCLPSSSSQSRALNKFDWIHCDIWTCRYYCVQLQILSCYFLWFFSYVWIFLLRLKSGTFCRSFKLRLLMCTHTMR